MNSHLLAAPADKVRFSYDRNDIDSSKLFSISDFPIFQLMALI